VLARAQLVPLRIAARAKRAQLVPLRIAQGRMVSLGRRDGRVWRDAQEHAAQVRCECPCYDARLLSVVLLEHRLPRAHQIAVVGAVRGSAHHLVTRKAQSFFSPCRAALGFLALLFHLLGLGGRSPRRRGCSRFEWDGRLLAAPPAGAVVIPAPSL
jgi:hypothetical protein